MDNFAQQKEVIWNEVETYLDGKTQKLRAEGLDRVLSGGSFLARSTITLAGFPDSSTQSTRRGRGKGAASTGTNDQDRIAGVAHDRLGHTTEHPALHAGAAMRAHCDQRIEGFSRRCDNFVCFETLFSCE
jgi:hypothetical protein